MRFWHAWWACALAALLVLPAACAGGSDTEQTPRGLVIVTRTPTGQVTTRPRSTAMPTATPTPSPLSVCSVNPDPASPQLLQVVQPRPDQQVKIPFYVSGWGSNIGFENLGVALAVLDAKETVLQVLDLPPQPREFRVAPPGIQITEYTRPFGADIVINGVEEPTPFCLWVYQETTETGAPKGVVQVPVLVLP